MTSSPDPSQTELTADNVPGRTPAIETHGLSKHFGQRKAVDGLTMSIPAGTIAGFVGPIGANKASDSPGRDAHGEAIDGFALPEVLAQAMGFDRRSATWHVIRRQFRLRGIRGGGHEHLRGRASCLGGPIDIVSSREAFPFSLFSLDARSRRAIRE